MSKLKIETTRGSYFKWSKIEFIIQNLEISDEYNGLQLDINEISDDYDLWKSTPAATFTKENDRIRISIELNYDLEIGLYIIAHLRFYSSNENIEDIHLTKEDYGIFPFEVIKLTDETLSKDDLIKKYQKIHKDRDRKFFGGFGYLSENMNDYTVLAFVKDCLIGSHMRLGFFEIIPFEGLEFNDEIYLINDFLNLHSSFNLNNSDDILKKAKQGQPTIVLHFPRLRVPNAEVAKKIAEKETELLLNVLSIRRGSSGALFGTLVVNLATGEKSFEPVIPFYRGNIFTGFIAKEYPPGILEELNKVRNDPLMNYYLNLYKEALKENTYEFSSIRFWNILETIARGTVNEGDYLFDMNRNIRKLPDGQKMKPVNERTTSGVLVFELLRRVIKAQNLSENFFGSNLDQDSLEELVTIWNRRRDCFVHFGGCFPDDSKICKTNDYTQRENLRMKYVKCKMARDEILNKHNGNDGYLRGLQEAANASIIYKLYSNK